MGLIQRFRHPRAADPAAAMLPAPAPVPAGPKARAAEVVERLLMQLEGDIFLTMRIITHAAANVEARIEESMAANAEIRAASHELSGLSVAAQAASLELTRTTERLTLSTRTIERSVAGADQLTAAARQLTGEGKAGAQRLSREVEGIESVVALIAAIARQTNLLALNAGLEAARAGPAGRGLAVIANEIKSLAQKTQKSTSAVHRQVSDLQNAARDSARVVDRISALVARVGPVVSAVKRAAAEQIAETQVVSKSAEQSAAFAEKVAAGTAQAGDLAEKSTEASARATRAQSYLTGSLERLTQRSVVFLRHARIGDRRKTQRVPAKIPCSIELGGEKRHILALDISLGGALLMGEGLKVRPGSMARLTLENIGTIPVTIVAQSDLGLHTRFDTMTGEITDRIERLIAQVHTENLPRIDLAQAAARDLEDAFREAVKYGDTTVNDLITIDYQPIEGTNPVQYTTPALTFYDRVLPPILNRHRASPLKPLFVVATDKNSYLPVHHPEFSVRQRRDDPEWNLINARNRSILERSQTLVGARNTEPYNLRVYTRQLNDGTFSPIVNIVAPIQVEDQHWGNIQVGFEL